MQIQTTNADANSNVLSYQLSDLVILLDTRIPDDPFSRAIFTSSLVPDTCSTN